MAFSYVIDSSDRQRDAILSEPVPGLKSSPYRTIYQDVAWQPGFDTLLGWHQNHRTAVRRTDLASLVAVHNEFADVAGTGLEIIAVERTLDLMAKCTCHDVAVQARRVRVCRSLAEARRPRSELAERPATTC